MVKKNKNKVTIRLIKGKFGYKIDISSKRYVAICYGKTIKEAFKQLGNAIEKMEKLGIIVAELENTNNVMKGGRKKW